MANAKIKVKIHVKHQPHRNDAMFYYEKRIATVSKGKRKIYVESAGEMQAYFEENGDCYKNEMLAKELRSRGTTDIGLRIMRVNDRIMMNNWFLMIGVELCGGDIAHTYDDAIALAKELINKEELW